MKKIVPVFLAIVLLSFSFGFSIPKTSAANNLTPQQIQTIQATIQSILRQTQTLMFQLNTLQQNNQSQTDTQNWLTYSNSKYGFEVKYPQNAPVPGNNDIGGTKVGTDSYDFYIFASKDAYINFYVYQPTTAEQNMALDQFVAQTTKKVKSQTNRTVGNTPAIQVYYQCDTIDQCGSAQVGGNGWIAFQEKSDIFIKEPGFYLVLRVFDNSQDSQLVEKLLSTFKITTAN